MTGMTWAATGDGEKVEFLTQRHYHWIDVVNRCGCAHEAIIINSSIEFVSCEQCEAALEHQATA